MKIHFISSPVVDEDCPWQLPGVHDVSGSYQSYTDASDVALGASLQQVQPIKVSDLKGTPTYDKLAKAWSENKPIPHLFPILSKDVEERTTADDVWGATLDDTIVLVEHVIAYWSRTFKAAERNYSATEREALGAKEALVKFQPFIEGETVILITDHAALQWARVYENANRRLAAWGAVFAAYPGLKIVHRAGRVHSNVDPLSRLPRIPPHNSPIVDGIATIAPDEDKQERAQAVEDRIHRANAPRAAFTVSCWEDLVERRVNATHYEPSEDPSQREADRWAAAEAQSRRANRRNKDQATEPEAEASPATEGTTPVAGSYPTTSESTPTTSESAHIADELPFPSEDHWTYPIGVKPSSQEFDDEWLNKPHLLVAMNPSVIAAFAQSYSMDKYFASKYVEDVPNPKSVITPSHFRKSKNGLLYFIDADWSARLCVPESRIHFVLKWIHDSPYESAHAGPRRFLSRLRDLFFWPTMHKDVMEYMKSCDTCQKIKVDRRAQAGSLRPAHIPARPFSTVSLDLITGLPPSGEEGFTAIFAIVDKLTKFAIFLPAHDTMSQERFADLFVERVANVYGLPERIIADRDKRWSTAFWKSVVSNYGSVMALSSSHHPQTDGQTEILNATIEQMLRAYVAKDRASWARWLSVLNYSYNSSVHSSTGYAPHFLLMGYKPRTSTVGLTPEGDPVTRPFIASQSAEEFIGELEFHRAAARDALVLAQERQATAYNKGRRPVEALQKGDLVLINPHTLKLVDVKGTGRKLVQRTIGPFEVLEQINPQVYRLKLPPNYPMHPVFNIEHLKKYHPSPTRFEERETLPSTRELIAYPEYEVESIVGHRLTTQKRGNRRMYLVHWKGHEPVDDTWVSEYDLRNAPEVTRAYLRAHNL